jgi:hypothetical protein
VSSRKSKPKLRDKKSSQFLNPSSKDQFKLASQKKAKSANRKAKKTKGLPPVPTQNPSSDMLMYSSSLNSYFYKFGVIESQAKEE